MTYESAPVGRLVVVMALLLAAVPASAQVNYLTGELGTWKPWKMTASPSARRAQAATAADVKAFEATLFAFREILRRAPSATEPRGFSVETWGHLGGVAPAVPGHPAPKTLPIAGGVDFGAFPIFEYEKEGRTIRSDTGETALLVFLVNDLHPTLIGKGTPPEWRELDTDAILQPTATGDRAGWPRYDDIMVLTKRTASIWKPLTLESAWALQLEAAKATLAKAKETLEKFRADLAAETDPARRAARQADRVRVSASMPEPQAFLKQTAEGDEIREASLREALGPSGGVMKAFTEAEQAVARIDARIVGLTPAEKSAQACYAPSATSPDDQFRAAPSPGCEPLARPNPDFFDRSLPRTAPQIVIVFRARRCYEEAPPTTLVSGCPANRALLESLDRQALLDWLR